MQPVFTPSFTVKEREVLLNVVENYGLFSICYYPYTEDTLFLVFGSRAAYETKANKCLQELNFRVSRFSYVAADRATIRQVDNGDMWFMMVPVFMDSSWRGEMRYEV